MDKKSKIVLIVSIVSMLVIVSVASYAYLRTYSTQTDINKITALDCLDISYESLSNEINIENAYPISDEEGLATKPYTFKIKNNCPDPVSVQINIETLKQNDTTTTLDLKYVKVSLDKDIPALLSSKSAGTRVLANTVSTDSKNLTTVILSQNEEREYDLRLWVDESVDTTQMGKTYKGKVVVVASPIMITPISRPDWNVNSDTLLYALKNGKYIYANPLTAPGQAVSLESEGIISSASDDYGTSYYFRGNIDDNYVVFANMCWRIVRITGSDGEAGDYNNAIKLVLYNYNPDNLSNPCAQIGNTLAFARYDGETYWSKFNESSKNASAGYMYGDINGTTYEETHANLHDSTILTNLKTWYDSKLRSYSDNYIADTIWCNDKSIVTDTTFNVFRYDSVQGTGIGQETTYYGTTYRYATNNNEIPNMICPDAGNDEKISKFTASDIKYGNGKLHGINASGSDEYKIGMLTANEILYAGAAYLFEGSGATPWPKNYYLYVNAHDGTTSQWTLTPSVMKGYGMCFWYIRYNGAIVADMMTISLGRIRPSISLRSTVTINNGSDGTAKNPYIIQESTGE